MSGPRILVVNDDGVDSPGIIAVAEALAALGSVTVVAPNRDCSGVGHSISIWEPVRIARVDDRAVPTYRCSGTPADCVVIGAFDLAGGKPDVLVSGINRGSNLGDDVNYSGTVAAAVEGTLIGIPSVALSLTASWPKSEKTLHWPTASSVGVDIVRDVLANGIPSERFLNVNIPNVAPEEIRGSAWTRLGRKVYRDRLDQRADPRGDTYYWIWGSFDPSQIEPGTDLRAVGEMQVSITPLTIQRTCDTTLAARNAVNAAGAAAGK